ncbi:PREDICTED: opsin, blue-sensitive-like [Atta cephalotes]|uniref:G-protein coupled receptors family 1 profile domain-containing protein n=1 Tax=Atta cephalotes TaxID=12957 RepID=A0A158NT70_ATTCE|nr:PREDICTED: opsin, blue-sensitive-like [Atta cephalotes]
MQLVQHFLGWNFPPEHADLVHPHWRVFLAPGRLWHVALALIYFLLLMLSLLGNGIVIWIFSTSKSLRTPSNIFILNLAVFDLLMATEMPMLIINSFLERTIGWETGCDVYALLGAISGMGQAITNAAIAFDRYRTISCPIDGRLNGKQAMVLALFTWFWALPFSILPMTGLWGRYVAAEIPSCDKTTLDNWRQPPHDFRSVPFSFSTLSTYVQSKFSAPSLHDNDAKTATAPTSAEKNEKSGRKKVESNQGEDEKIVARKNVIAIEFGKTRNSRIEKILD